MLAETQTTRPLEPLERAPLPDTTQAQDARAATEHEAGGVIEAEGAPEPRLRILLSGWAARARLLPDGRRQIVRVLIPGDLCGVSRRNTPSTASTIALTRARTADQGPITRFDLHDAWQTRIDAIICDTLAAEQKALLTHIVRLGRMTGYERTSHFLLELYERLTRANLAQGRFLPLPLTQEMLADALGLSAVHVNRTLQQLRDEGHVAYGRGRFAITDPARLASLCGYEFETSRVTPLRPASPQTHRAMPD